MSISENDIKEHEDRYTNLLYDTIGETISIQSRIITQINKIGKYVDIDTDLPNIGITFNNKLNELSQIFKKAGISMFANPNEEYGFVDSNFVGDAIIEDMFSQLSKATQAFSEYDSTIRKITKQKMEKVKALEESGPIKKLFLKIRSFFVPTASSDLLLYSEEEVEEINSNLSEYKEIDKNLWKYNLKDNIVQSLVKSINNGEYHDFVIGGLLEESVIPTLQKLGLEDVIPQLQEELSKSQQSSNGKSWELSQTQKLEIQMSTERVADEFEQTGSFRINNEDKEYSK